MTDEDRDELDARLGRRAKESLERAASSVDPNDEWAAFQDRLDPTRSQDGVAGRRRDRPLAWLAAAGVAAVIAGVVALVVRDDGGSLRSADAPESAASTATPVATATTTTTTTTFTTATPAIATTTVAPVPGVALATPNPRVAGAGDEVAITPTEPVERLCGDVVALGVPDGGGGYADAGVLSPGDPWTFRPELDRVESCPGRTTPDSQVITIPPDLPGDDYRMCIADQPEGCALVTIVGPDPAPTSSTTTTIATTTTTPTTPTSPVGELGPGCWQSVVAPPSLADGSPTGEAIVEEIDGIQRATWGSGTFAAVDQDVGVEPDATVFDDPFVSFAEGSWTAVIVTPRVGPVYEVVLRDDATGCALGYSLGRGFQFDDVEDVAAAWVAELGGARPVRDSRHEDLVAPVPYVAERLFFELGARPGVTVHDIAPDGTDLGARPRAAVQTLIDHPVDVGGGRRLGLDGRPDDYCAGAPVVLTGPRGAVDPAVFGDVTSIAGSRTGFVAIVRPDCDGATWGQPGTGADMLVFDLGDLDAGPTLARRIEPDPDGIPFSDRWSVVSVSPDGRYVGVRELTSIETARYHVLDTIGSEAGEPIAIGSACRSPGNLVGSPRFVDDGFVVVARSCGEDDSIEQRDLLVEVIDLAELQPVWSEVVEGGVVNSYSEVISGLSATSVNGEVWVIVTSAAFEQPNRTWLVTTGRQTEITRLGPFVEMAFRAADLIGPWNDDLVAIDP